MHGGGAVADRDHGGARPGSVVQVSAQDAGPALERVQEHTAPQDAVPTRPSVGRHVVRSVRTALAVLSCLVLGAPVAPPATLTEDFSGPDGVFVSESAFYDADDLGLSENADWFAESGALLLQAGVGRTDAPVFRMWTRRTDLQFVTVSMDVRFRGWAGGDQPWHGINLWLNETLCSPAPDCSRVDDRGGVSGYALDFVNRDGTVTVLKKVAGDTRAVRPERAGDFVQGGTYYELAATRWSPRPGRTYRLEAEVVDLGDGGALLRITIDDDVVLEVVDDGTVAGPPLVAGGRVGLRSDHADFEVDDIRIRRSSHRSSS